VGGGVAGDVAADRGELADLRGDVVQRDDGYGEVLVEHGAAEVEPGLGADESFGVDRVGADPAFRSLRFVAAPPEAGDVRS
jgi:hypothetical protein